MIESGMWYVAIDLTNSFLFPLIPKKERVLEAVCFCLGGPTVHINTAPGLQ